MSDLTHLPLHDQIKILRTQLGITQIELAERLNITKQSVSSWESGKVNPSNPNLHKMDQIFKSNLLGSKSSMTVSDATEPYHTKVDIIIEKLNMIIEENNHLRHNYMTAIMENHEYFNLVKKLKNQIGHITVPPQITDIINELVMVKSI